MQVNPRRAAPRMIDGVGKGLLRLAAMMRARGACGPEMPSSEQVRDLERAKQRCNQCNAKGLCDEILESGSTAGYSRFCPNAPYLEQLRTHALEFDK